jgi:hypothetical protein
LTVIQQHKCGINDVELTVNDDILHCVEATVSATGSLCATQVLTLLIEGIGEHIFIPYFISWSYQNERGKKRKWQMMHIDKSHLALVVSYLILTSPSDHEGLVAQLQGPVHQERAQRQPAHPSCDYTITPHHTARREVQQTINTYDLLMCGA